jgi:hypothetical protein
VASLASSASFTSCLNFSFFFLNAVSMGLISCARDLGASGLLDMLEDVVFSLDSNNVSKDLMKIWVSLVSRYSLYMAMSC